MRRPNRCGFSLLEVILATSILLGCLIVLGELAAIGRRHADDAEELTTAQMICRSRLAEILAGAVPLEAVEDQPADVAGWTCSVAVEPLARRGLVAVEVTASRDGERAADDPETPRSSYTLTRWIYAPGQLALGASTEEDTAFSPSDLEFPNDDLEFLEEGAEFLEEGMEPPEDDLDFFEEDLEFMEEDLESLEGDLMEDDLEFQEDTRP